MIKLIACVDKNMGIGKDNKLLTHLPKDLAHFKRTTEGEICLFGKSTYNSLPVKPLPNRLNVILTRDEKAEFEGGYTIHTIEPIIRYAVDIDVFICGGETLYKQFLPYADELIISHMDADFEADTFFPTIGEEWINYDSESVEDKVNFEIKYYAKAKELHIN